MISKKVDNVVDALLGVTDGMTLLFGGFGLCGIPENSISELVRLGVKNITCVSNNAGVDDFGLGLLLKNHQIKKMISSYVGENKEFEKQMLNNEIEVELIPQGTLAERCRSAKVGIPAFFTPAGVGTEVSIGKEIRVFNQKEYLLEYAVKANYSFIKAWKGDESGNIVFKGTARNFNQAMCGAAKVNIVEVEELVGTGDLNPNEIHVPGVFVQRIFEGDKYEKRIEKRTVID